LSEVWCTPGMGRDVHAMHKLLGHKAVATTTIRADVLNRGSLAELSPLGGWTKPPLSLWCVEERNACNETKRCAMRRSNT